jgi:hypothetical protein
VAAACRTSRSFVLASLRALHLDLRLRRRRDGSDRGMPGPATGAGHVPGLKLEVVWPPGVGDRGLWAVAQLCLPGAGGQRGSDLVPGVAVEQGAGHQLGEEAFGLAGEAGDQGDGGQVVAEPGAAPLSQRGEGAGRSGRRCAAAARAGAGGCHGCLLPVFDGRAGVAVRTGMSHRRARSYQDRRGPEPTGGGQRGGGGRADRSQDNPGQGVSRLSGQARRQVWGAQVRGRRW